MSGVSLGSLFASDGFYWILAAAFLAGVVRGFSGFGSAMIFLPVAGQFMPPVSALTVLTVMDVFGPLLAVPKAFKEARKPDLARLLSAMILVFPFALWLLTRSDPAIFR
ncbi:MAG: TSUP family transporter, partial [Paracoccaceae bacterium]